MTSNDWERGTFEGMGPGGFVKTRKGGDVPLSNSKIPMPIVEVPIVKERTITFEQAERIIELLDSIDSRLIK